MSTSGLQTHDFLTRLTKVQDDFPPLLLKLAGVSGHAGYDSTGDRRATTPSQITGHRTLDLEV